MAEGLPTELRLKSATMAQGTGIVVLLTLAAIAFHEVGIFSCISSGAVQFGSLCKVFDQSARSLRPNRCRNRYLKGSPRGPRVTLYEKQSTAHEQCHGYANTQPRQQQSEH
jgi:hypothetical protein